MRLLNVGGGSKEIPIPDMYDKYQHDLLDIDPGPDVDYVCDARMMPSIYGPMSPSIYDVVYCSHNLEHYFAHDVPQVLLGMMYVLKPGGSVHIVVPNIGQLIWDMVHLKLDLEDVLYESDAGPITPLDVFYGFGREIEESSNDFYAHKTGFTAKRLHRVLEAAGFEDVIVHVNRPSLELIAFGKSPGRKSLLSAVSGAAGIPVPSVNAEREVSDVV